MPLIAIPNASTGSDAKTIRALADAIRDAGAILLDIHAGTCGHHASSRALVA